MYGSAREGTRVDAGMGPIPGYLEAAADRERLCVSIHW